MLNPPRVLTLWMFGFPNSSETTLHIISLRITTIQKTTPTVYLSMEMGFEEGGGGVRRLNGFSEVTKTLL